MNIQELLEQINMGTTDHSERQRRVDACLNALAHGAEVRGVIDNKVTTVGFDGTQYTVTQVWTIMGGAK